MDVADDRNVSPSSESDHRTKLRQRCELATVLNFLTVFEPLLKSKMKVTAEDIEMAIIEPNDLLAKLHVMLLKGIPPVSKTLDRADAWVTALCKKLSDWWPWVAVGDLPLTVNKGKEISEYKELEPTTRLVVLKALCEIRLEQGDAVSYISNTMKTGSEVSTFRKDKICGDEKGTLYWLDGDASIGYRLYKEVRRFESKQSDKGKGFLPAIDVQWETLATSLEEFRKVVVEFSSSKVMMEVDVCKTVEANVLPVLEKLHKKRERAVKQQKSKETVLSGYQFSGLTRTCRTRTAVCYTYDEYDKRISEAISVHQQQPKKRKIAKEREDVKKTSDSKKTTETASGESSGSEIRGMEDSKQGDNKEGTESISQERSEFDMKAQDDIVPDSETESERHQDVDIVDNVKSEDIVSDSETESERQDGDIDDNSDVEWDEDIKDASSEDNIASNSSDKENSNLGNKHVTCARRREGLPRSKTVAGVVSPAQENSNQGAKDRPRGRHTRKSSLESFVAPDSEEASSANSSGRSSSVNLSDDSDLS
ncbi:DDT domain-containing protein DDR4 [Heracleum sosnowskyi]|uniref:DDT domain-containing protein DDR4 n=1 Tax=Heracleum sosnowskyi TaxID=360622 RepID=A0AAD8ID19_9APIA|nr:DDT domain-containing protein DDR4 [Heracleum sosnowskyi]